MTVTASTRKIRVSVHCSYQNGYSNPEANHYFFSYRIRIQNNGNENVQLLSREWKIADALGKVRIVKGEGVVGEQPVILPGEYYEYSSGCDLQADFGAMEGNYIFQNLESAESFRVKIPRFLLERPVLLN